MTKRSVTVEGKVTWLTEWGMRTGLSGKIVCNRHVEKERVEKS